MWTIRSFATAYLNEQPLASTTRSGGQMVSTQNSHRILPRHSKLEPCSTGFSMCVRVPVLVALHMARCALHFLHHLSNSMRSARKMAGSSMPLIWKDCKAVLRAQWCVLMHWRWRHHRLLWQVKPKAHMFTHMVSPFPWLKTDGRAPFPMGGRPHGQAGGGADRRTGGRAGGRADGRPGEGTDGRGERAGGRVSERTDERAIQTKFCKIE